MSFVYLATPYSDKSPLIRRDRFEKSQELSVLFARNGITVYSPIALWHPMAELYDLPKAFNFWRTHDFNMIRSCSCLVAVELIGSMLEESIGVMEELIFARKLGITVFRDKEVIVRDVEYLKSIKQTCICAN